MIQTDPLRVHQVLEDIRSLRMTTEAREGMGPFDIVAFIDADGIADLAPLLYGTTFTMPGVCEPVVVDAEEAFGQRGDGRASG